MSEITSFEKYRDFAGKAADVYNAGEYKKALEMFQELSRVNYDNIKVHETLAYIQLKLNNVAMAEKEFEIVLELARKRNQLVHLPRTFDELVRQMGDVRELEQDYKRIMTAPVPKGELLQTRTAIHLGIHYMAQGKYKQAEEILVKYKKKCEAALA